MDDFFARNRLSAWLDGELGATEAREVEDALARSPELRAEVETLRAHIKLLREAGPMTAPPGFADRLGERLRAEPAPVGWTRHLRRVRVEAVMLAAAAALVLVFASRTRPVEPEPTPAPPVATTEVPAPEVDVAGMPGTEPAAVTLGDEAPSAVERIPSPKVDTSKVTKSASKVTKSGSVEKEPFVASWEAQPEVAPTVHSPAQFRLQPTTEMGLKDLEALAASLGGHLTDARGKPMAAYPLDPGEHKTVKLVLPAVASGEVARRLADLGKVDVVNVTERTLYANGATVPIVIEVYRE
jgi:anti-sigma factor RsiW